MSAAACTVLVLLSLSLSHLFQSVFLCDEDEPLPGKAQGLSFDEQVRVCYKSSTVLFLFPWNPSPLFSRGGEVVFPVAVLSSAGYRRTDRASAARSFAIGMVRASPRCLQPSGAGGERREARGFFPGSAALGPGGSCLPLAPLCWERQRLEGPLPAGPAAARCLQVRFLLLIYSRNSALPSVVVQGIVARVRIQKRALANAKIRRI